MAMQRARIWVGLFLAGLTAGCGDSALEGHYFQLNFTGVENGCTAAAPNTTERLEYRVIVEAEDLEIAVGPDVFASGVALGCDLSYNSVIWTEDRNGYEIRWQINGTATYNPGGCNPANGQDWDGIEVFEVIASDDPELAPGCQYTMLVEGTFLETL